jgi:hypothetical protein
VLATWLHWYMVVFFVLFGAWILKSRRCFSTIGPLVGKPSGDSPYADRLCEAIARREELEALPGPAIGTWIGVSSLAAGLLAALTPIPVTLLYAVVCVVLAGTLAAAYLRLRRAGERRIASLRARSRETAVPAWLSALIAVAAVSPLAYADVAPVAAFLVAAAALLIVVLGDRVVHLPALLTGEDPAIEEYVDDRLRAVRSVNLFATATAPPYVFEAITFTIAFVQNHARFETLHLAAMLLSLVALLVSCAWQFVQVRRAPGASDVERWAQNGV